MSERALPTAIAMALSVLLSAEAPASDAAWKAGTTRIKITPAEPHCLCGWGGHDREADGTYHDLWIKILALEDARGRRGVVITSDVMGFSKATYDAIRDGLKQRCGLDRSQVKLTYSHTHTGPVLRELLQDYYPLSDAQWDQVRKYSLWLEKSIVEHTAQALSELAPASLWTTDGQADFAVNRRNNPEREVPAIRERDGVLRGPVDHAVPVLVVKTPAGDFKTLVFGYACHCTTVPGFNRWSGDYAGVAQIALEKRYPGIQAMFFAGCGADQNPLPRGQVELYEKYGAMLAASVRAALDRPLSPVRPVLQTAFEFVPLDFLSTMTAAELKDHVSRGGIYGRWAARMLKQLENGRPFATSYPYAVQVWKLGEDRLWISLGGEVVVDYALKFKEKYGPRTWVNGFSHDLTAYMPSARVWQEGGYEAGSLGEYGLPAMRWAGDLEDRIAASVERMQAAFDREN
ncbi:MAG: hypothetical protein HUU20_20910 [Pirellulales bacterium]|nr:hypothetical protein [Pirellulales bacterium]